MDEKYEWDESKRRRNFELHGYDFADIRIFDWNSDIIIRDARQEYGETRFIAYGLFLGRLTVLVYTLRGDKIRIISWRKGNAREKKKYDAENQE